MAVNRGRLVMVRPQAKSFYERWIASEGVPVLDGIVVPDVYRVPLRYWKRLGCDGAYLQLKGLQGITGAYLGKIAPGAATEPEKHLYEKIIYILEGEGVAEVQQRNRVPQTFFWQAGSLFAPPINSTHRLTNYSKEPARFLAVTTAPAVFDHFHNERFIFNSDFCFSERYDGQSEFFAAGEQRYLAAQTRQWVADTNFIADVKQQDVAAHEQIGAGVGMMQFELANNTLSAQLTQWPLAAYHKAHYQGGGAIFVALKSKGYSLAWPMELGPRPYESGYGDLVTRIDWEPGSVFSPPAHSFQQHFNTGAEPALQLALACGSQKFPLGVTLASTGAGVYTSVKQGGTLIEYVDEDPTIRRHFAAELRQSGIAPAMPFDVATNDV
jgi:Cupin domain